MARDLEAARREMVECQIRTREVRDPRVLAAMSKVPRHLFVPERNREQSYEDSPVSIGRGQTISQPFMVALMTECLQPAAGDRVLEVGTGSGYQTAVLAELVQWVYSVERIEELARQATATLAGLGYRNLSILTGDGSLGFPEQAPFDGILVTAGSPAVPDPLLAQLGAGGRLVVPVGDAHHQTLYRIVRDDRGNIQKEAVTGCVFVPLIGTHGWEDQEAKRRR